MKRLTWWKRTAALRCHPLILMIPCGTGLAIIAYSLAKYGFSNAVLHSQLLIGLSVGLVHTLFEKWLTRRHLEYYVHYYLGLRPPDLGIALLPIFPMALLLSAFGIALDHWEGGWKWAGMGAYLVPWILIYPEMKALHEGIKAKLAEMENNDE